MEFENSIARLPFRGRAWDFAMDFEVALGYAAAAAGISVDGGWDPNAAANGSQNFRQYAGSLVMGPAAAGAMAFLDYVGEYLMTGDPEDLAEVYADLAGLVSTNVLWDELGKANDSLFVLRGFDDAGWAKVQHLPGRLWRIWFCRRKK